MKRILVTGSSGLIGSEMVDYFSQYYDEVHGFDNNMRKEFFGAGGDTLDNLNRLQKKVKNFIHHSQDIRDKDGVFSKFKELKFDAIIHCASQPSHDLAASIPFKDFEVNANATLNLLEATRQFTPDSVFVFTSTNKVYGDAPNHLELQELETRYDFAQPEFQNGIPETLSIDHCVHSLFGVSKVAADLLVQEYGKNFGLKTTSIRGGCLTGPNHAGVELHGFLSYLIKACLNDIPYTIFGYKGKQVRDNIHSLDVAKCVHEIIKKPTCGEAFNIGGGKENACSMMEAIAMIEKISGKQMNTSYSEQNRTGDHICYYSDLSKLKKFYPDWKITKSLEDIFQEIYESFL
jgi:CDP-paratose 2-epimerase